MKSIISIITIMILSIANCMAIDAVYDGTNGIKEQVLNACLGCHSSDLSGSSRNGAPSSVNFDSYQLALNSAERAVLRGAGGSMPPFGSEPLNEEQKNALLAWQDAGFPEAEVIVATPTPTPTPEPTATPTPEPTASPEPTPTLSLPHLASGVILTPSNSSTTPFSSTSFNGAVLSDGEIINSTPNTSEILAISGQIVVAPEHQGQQADILIVAGYQSENNSELFFQKDSANNFIAWDGNPLTLMANQKEANLSAIQEIDIYSGALIPGKFRIFMAYRLESSQEIVFNGTALEFEVISSR